MSSLNRVKSGGHGVPGGINPQGRGGPGAAGIAKSAAPLPSSQYLDAINTLCEATMAEACALCLSESDYDSKSGANGDHQGNNNNNNHKSDYDKLLEIEQKCRDAVKVIHKEAVVAPPPTSMLPPSLPNIPASRVNPAVAKKAGTATKGNNPTAKALVGSISKTIPPSATSKTGAIPIRRGSLTSNANRPPANKRSMVQQPLHRAESDESSIGSSSNTSGANKRPRLGGPSPGSIKNNNLHNNTPTSTTSSHEGAVGDTPPPSALDFLKKLNQDKATAPAPSDSKQLSRTDSKGKKDKAKDKDEGDNLSEAESNASDNSASRRPKRNATSPTNSSLPPPREGVRKNPARGARR